MKHLKKFEELDYSTYTSAADKLASFGQKTRSSELRSHGVEMERKKIENYSFDILVGEVKTVPNAKFKSLSIVRESQAYSLVSIFESSAGTHRVSSILNDDGTIMWRDNNKFSNRKSVNNFSIVLKLLSKYQPDFVKLLEELGLTTDQLQIVHRTFYI